MTASLKSVTGMHDALPEEVGRRRQIEQAARRVLETFGYQEVQTPVLEYADLFRKGSGETTDVVEKELFSFVDQGDEELVLRPEGTPSIARLVLQHGLVKQSPFVKLYYIAPMFRRERPQRGRYRQHTQVGVEAIGSPHPEVDAEQLAMLVAFLAAAGVAPVTLRLNNLGCREAECRPRYLDSLKRYASSRVADLCENCQRRLERNPLRVLDCKSERCQRAMQDAPMIGQFLCAACVEHGNKVRDYLGRMNPPVPFVEDPRLVRGFDYYTRTIYEVIDPQLGAQNALCGGGRYDGLFETLGASPTPAVGFAVGVERLLNWLEDHGSKRAETPRSGVYLATMGSGMSSEAFTLAQTLRHLGIVVHGNPMPDRSLKGQFKYADQLGVRYVAILGPDEMVKHVVSLRDMMTSQQESVPWDGLAARVTT